MNGERKAMIVEAVLAEVRAAERGSAPDACEPPMDDREVQRLGDVLRDTCAWDDHDVEIIVKSSLPVAELSWEGIRCSIARIFARV